MRRQGTPRPVVGEAYAYVQGASPKAYAALLARLLNSPITGMGGDRMRIKLIIVVAASALACTGCSVTEPVAVISKEVPGGVMRGTTTASLSGGSFNVSSGALSCGGTYNALDTSPTLSIPVLCNDGRKGIITATREASGTSGGGHFSLTDGTTGDFMFGEAAARL